MLQYIVKNCLILIGGFLSLGYSLSALSAESSPKVYQVELVLFSHITAEALNAEHWPILARHTPDLDDLTELTPAAEANPEKPYFTLLPKSAFKLNREADALDRDPEYKTVLHIAWRQPITESRHAARVHIYGGASYDSNGGLLTENPFAIEPYTTQKNWQVDGSFKISVLRYLNASFDLQFAAARDEILSLSNTSNFDDTQGGLVYFQLAQTRRMRSQELNYIDYPLYGALIKVTPVSDK